MFDVTTLTDKRVWVRAQGRIKGTRIILLTDMIYGAGISQKRHVCF